MTTRGRRDPPAFRFSAERRKRLCAGPLSIVDDAKAQAAFVAEIERALWLYRLLCLNEPDHHALSSEASRLKASADCLATVASSIGPDVFTNRALARAYGLKWFPPDFPAAAQLQSDEFDAFEKWREATRTLLLSLADAYRAQASIMRRARGGQENRPARALIVRLVFQWVVSTGRKPSAAQGSQFMRLIDWLRDENLFHASRTLVASCIKGGP